MTHNIVSDAQNLALHDWRLRSISSENGAMKLGFFMNEHSMKLDLLKPRIFICSDFMIDNLVDWVVVARISENNLHDSVEQLLQQGSAYFTQRSADHAKASGDFIGLKLLVGASSYGANFCGVCEEIEFKEANAGS